MDQIKKTEKVRKKYSLLRIATAVFGVIIGLILASMLSSGIRGEGYSLYCAYVTQKARLVGVLLENQNYKTASKLIGFSGRDKDAESKWIEEMEEAAEEFIFESVEISPIILDDHFPTGKYTVTVFDCKTQTSHMYEGFVTGQNGGIAFADAALSQDNLTPARGIIESILDNAFVTYNPG